jgi:hypothetical protein
MKKLVYISIFVSLMSCETDITPNLPDAIALVAVDAWIYHKAEAQIIDLTLTNTYFNAEEPSRIPNAIISVTDLNTSRVYSFVEDGDSKYVWNPTDANDTFGIIGNAYYLSIELVDRTIESVSILNDVMPVDSITFRFEEGNSFSDDYYVGEFWATDLIGEGDAYWIKSWKNEELLNLPSEINLAFDGAFSEGDNADGLTFPLPIRDAISPFEFDDNDRLMPPFELEDSVFVEISSITPEAFFFIRSARDQINRSGGFGELFALPLANIQSNLFSSNPNEKVVGFFCVSATSSLGRKFTEDAIRIVEE